MAKPIKIKKGHEGLLHKELGVKDGKTIGEKRLHAAARSAKKRGGTAEEKRVVFAENFGKARGK